MEKPKDRSKTQPRWEPRRMHAWQAGKKKSSLVCTYDEYASDGGKSLSVVGDGRVIVRECGAKYGIAAHTHAKSMTVVG